MKKSKAKGTSAGKARSWKDIQANRMRFRDTAAARQRRMRIILKGGVMTLAVLCITVLSLSVYYFFQSKQEPVFTVTDSAQRVEVVDWNSDGVLHREWFYRNYPGIFRQSISRVDIHDIKRSLESSGQIREAHLTIVFPNRLRVQVSEREPILRARVQDSEGNPDIVLIARDGTVYKGQGYPRETMRRLPGVTGLRLRHDGRGFLPIEGMDSIALLLDRTRELMPEVYTDWALVSLEHYQNDSDRPLRLIEVRGRTGSTIVFAPARYDEQLVRLRNILAVSGQRQMPQPSYIDLSFRNHAVVRK